MTNGEYKIVLVKEEYFRKYNSILVEMLDSTDVEKQARRMYMFLSVFIDNNNILIPLRSELPDITKLGLIGYHVPSEKRPNAGLDYRKMLIINDNNYLSPIYNLEIPLSQKNIISENYQTILKQAEQYIKGYKKAVNKNRHMCDKKFKFSTLHNFHKELCLIKELA